MGLGRSKFGRTYGTCRAPVRIREPYVISGITCIASTPKAIKIDLNPTGTWIPRKAIHPTSAVKDLGDSGIIRMQRWFAERMGWVR